jgi:hypothetical protein
MKIDALKKLIDEDLAKFRLAEARTALNVCLVEPYLVALDWPFEDEHCPSFWCVAEINNQVRLLYVSKNHRRADQWVVLHQDRDFVDGDDFWFASLEDAYFQSGCWNGPLPPDYEVS